MLCNTVPLSVSDVRVYMPAAVTTSPDQSSGSSRSLRNFTLEDVFNQNFSIKYYTAEWTNGTYGTRVAVSVCVYISESVCVCVCR